MRDLLVLSLVFSGSIAALSQPWIGIMLWTWISIMNPHRFTYGIAYEFPIAALAAITTLLGTLFTKEKDSPFKSSVVVVLFLFMIWITLSWLFGLDTEGDLEQWKKVMKIDFMILLALVVLRTKTHIFSLAWVAIGSLAILGAKGGIFTLASGGNYHVWGPPGSFIEDNNEFALALVMTIPMLRFLQLQLTSNIGKHLMTALMLLCAASAFGSQSRGALLAICAMALLLWWRGKNKLAVGSLIVLVGLAAFAFLPDTWFDRMSTISTYEDDLSSMGRISAWWVAWNLAFHYPLGIGFDAARPELFAIYSPYPNLIHAAHSIYFQVLGNHGFVGLGLFLTLWWLTWQSAGWLVKNSPRQAETEWCRDLGAMAQVSLAGYAVGGAFLSLAYFDLPYDIMVLVVLTKVWVRSKRWETEQPPIGIWKSIPGLATARKQS
ncbi:MAG: putative O-glycosylation ligase, exosortase A system-associated [Azonexus sp.]